MDIKPSSDHTLEIEGVGFTLPMSDSAFAPEILRSTRGTAGSDLRSRARPNDRGREAVVRETTAEGL